MPPVEAEPTKDAEPMINAGWTKLAELPENELPPSQQRTQGTVAVI